MKEVNPFYRYDEITTNLKENGAFLTVKDRFGKMNVMAIGWAMLGIMWRDPTLMVVVRPIRYTFQLIENADDFTLTIPYSDMNDKLVFCGTHSGKNIDKFKEGNLVVLPAQKTNSPIVEAKSARYYECKIVQKTVMDKSKLEPKYDQDLYQDKSYHTYYFGQIVACYEV